MYTNRIVGSSTSLQKRDRHRRNAPRQVSLTKGDNHSALSPMRHIHLSHENHISSADQQGLFQHQINALTSNQVPFSPFLPPPPAIRRSDAPSLRLLHDACGIYHGQPSRFPTTSTNVHAIYGRAIPPPTAPVQLGVLSLSQLVQAILDHP